MSKHHYDILILGNSLAARLAGALLAKVGRRLLTFADRAESPPAWLGNSLYMRQVLDLLGGRHQLVPAPRLQILCGQTRLELHGCYPLEEELQREFPSCHEQLCQLLQGLKTRGETLEQQLWESAGLPLFGLGGELRLGARLLLRRNGYRSLRQPLQRFLQEIQDPEARRWLDTLFSGLALQPARHLTLAEGALLWNNISQPQAIAESSFRELLEQRYAQFHGRLESPDVIEQLASAQSLRLQNGDICSADLLLLAEAGQAERFPNHKIGFNHGPQCWQTTSLNPPPAAILANRILLGGDPVLRLSLAPSAGDTVLWIKVPGTAAPLTEEELRTRLAALLPFSRFDLKAPPAPPTAAPANHRHIASEFPGTCLRAKINKQLLLASGITVVPHLNNHGEIMTGVALSKYLQGPSQRRGKVGS